MIKLIAKRYLKAGAAEEYISLAKELVLSSRKETGCVDYCLCYNAEENLCIMVETWRSQADLTAHSARLTAENWPARLNAFADPQKQGGVERYEQLV